MATNETPFDAGWTAAEHERFSVLIERKVTRVATEEELVEFRALKAKKAEWRDRVAPLPTERLEAFVANLKARGLWKETP